VVFVALAPLLWFAPIAFEAAGAGVGCRRVHLRPYLRDFVHVFRNMPNFLPAFKNSIIISLFTTAISLYLG
jgi:ABC-type glycerol-3-phosphate transport system permease component